MIVEKNFTKTTKTQVDTTLLQQKKQQTKNEAQLYVEIYGQNIKKSHPELTKILGSLY